MGGKWSILLKRAMRPARKRQVCVLNSGCYGMLGSMVRDVVVTGPDNRGNEENVKERN